MKIVELLWEKLSKDDNPIQLCDDRSDAMYYAVNNDNKLFICCEPDKQEPHLVRCDYLLVHHTETCDTIRFIELKGGDNPPRKGEKLCSYCCPQTWAHALHQLLATYLKCENLIEDQDAVKMILCTSWEECDPKPNARFKQYAWYKEIRAIVRFDITPQLMYCDHEDIV